MILISILSFVFSAICLGCFLKIRNDIQQVVIQVEANYFDCEKFFKQLECLVTAEQMRSYLETIDVEMRELNELREKFGKDKWKNFRTAFGGKETSED